MLAAGWKELQGGMKQRETEEKSKLDMLAWFLCVLVHANEERSEIS